MRALHAAFGACVLSAALAAAPAALLAQSAPAQSRPHPAHPPAHPSKPPPHGHGHGHGGSKHRPRPSYSPNVYVDATTVLNHYYSATPAPAPKKHQATPLPNGQEVFSTYSTDDAK